MIYIFLGIIAFAFFFIGVWMWNIDKQTVLLCEIHQKEWDKIKNELLENGATEIEISDKYLEYIEHLMQIRHEVYGACFPRK